MRRRRLAEIVSLGRSPEWADACTDRDLSADWVLQARDRGGEIVVNVDLDCPSKPGPGI